MKKGRNIHNLDSLEREIYRLKLEAKNISEKMDRNFEHFHGNFSSITMNSFCRKEKKKEGETESLFGSFLKNEKLNNFAGKITDRIANRAAESIDKLIDKIFHKKKHYSQE